jgi:hypothetical protein
MNMEEDLYIVQMFPDIEILFPVFLILIPCILWGLIERRLSTREFLISIGIIILTLTAIMMIFVPIWAIFPNPEHGFDLVIPLFVEIIPFTSLVFALFVYVPCIIRCIGLNDINLDSIRQKVGLLMLTAVAFFTPGIIELHTWERLDGQLHTGQIITLFTISWALTYWINGNIGGQNLYLRFSSVPFPEIIFWGFISLPGFIFIRYMIQIIRGEKKDLQLIITGFIQTLIWIELIFWIELVTAYGYRSVFIPCPCLILIGFAIIITHYILSRKSEGRLSKPEPIEVD